jgi:predicted secreted protein
VGLRISYSKKNKTFCLGLSLIFGFVLALIPALNPIVSAATAPVIQWNLTYGGTNDDYARSVIQTGDNGYLLAGTTFSYGVGGDAWIVKVDSSGNTQWNKSFGGGGSENAFDVIKTSDGGYALAAETTSYGSGGFDFWLVKVDSSGNLQWNKTYGGTSYDEAYCVVQTSDGGYALAGATASYGSGGYDFWLVKTDSSGNKQWDKAFGGTSDDTAYSIVQTNDGGFAITGSTSSFGSGKEDYWLVKTDSSGNSQWTKTYGGPESDIAKSIIRSSDGGFAIAGVSNWDTWLVKTDSSGNQLWNQTYGGTSAGSDQANSLVQTADGGYALAGVYGGYQDGWLVKADNSGTLQWSMHYKGTNAGYPEETDCVIQTNDEGYALAGRTYPTGSNQAEMWLVKVAKESVIDHFEFEIISSPQTVGNAFNIKITAKDQYNVTLTSYTGTNTLTYSAGTINPTSTTSFVAGVWIGSVTVSNAGTGATISTAGAGKNGISVSFNVNAAPTPTPVPTAIPTATPNPTSAPTSAPTATPTPTASPPPTKTTSPTPTIPELPTAIISLVLLLTIAVTTLFYTKKQSYKRRN